jgi:hypothetical protein
VMESGERESRCIEMERECERASRMDRMGGEVMEHWCEYGR